MHSRAQGASHTYNWTRHSESCAGNARNQQHYYSHSSLFYAMAVRLSHRCALATPYDGGLCLWPSQGLRVNG